MADEQNTELTLNTGTLLGIFFGLVVICGVFFSLGYAVGKNAGSDNTAAMSDSAANSNIVAAGGNKPPAGKAPAVEPAPETQATTPSNESSAAEPKTEQPAQPKTEATASAQPGAGFMVQIAAVSKQEDADALVAALRKKQYPVITVPDPSGNLFRVQVGPFPQQKDADEMRKKLVADGYNAIIKK